MPSGFYRRAESAKRFLISLGVDASRLTTVSFGEERPLESGNDEAAWAKNRRDQFVIKRNRAGIFNDMKGVIFISTVLLLAGGLSGCVTRQDLYSYDDRIYRMEQQLQQQNNVLEQSRNELSAYKSKAQQTRNQSASLTAVLDGMQQETRQLKGSLEELEYRVGQELGTSGQGKTRYSQRVDQLEAVVADLGKRVEYLEQYLNLEPPTGKNISPIEGKTPSVVTTTASPATESEIYSKAKEAFDSGDDETARLQFQALLKQYPKSKNADNAQFWIAEIFYREQWFEKAILEYQKVIENYPKGNKAPDAMLKQGLAFFKLGDKANARLLLKELIKKYPQTHAAQIARKQIETP